MSRTLAHTYALTSEAVERDAMLCFGKSGLCFEFPGKLSRKRFFVRVPPHVGVRGPLAISDAQRRWKVLNLQLYCCELKPAAASF